ncbi:MAG: TonB-dependent receptor [Candidatus Marinimicrobia bacterium]|nr:TonB-dependent receptor [Candidatus Neomarinimicrobiota bacterium]
MKVKTINAFCIILVVSHSILFAAGRGKIAGYISDVVTGKPLLGANVFLQGTALGSSTDREGYYSINSVPSGEYELFVSYIGYKQISQIITINVDKTLYLNLQLYFDVIEGEEVVITAQLEGQAQAINLQLSSNTISNIVSAERIQELPDANAAESVGRLPGVSIQRDGGEGNKIVIRGMSPTYNTITIEGANVAATDLDDRSVDLAMISPEILASIEVSKAPTADLDADFFGGKVNFKLADAPEGGFRYNVRLADGYNALRNEFGQYKGSLTLSNRFLDNKFGIMVTGNVERAQRGTDQFEAEYKVKREARPDEGEIWAPIRVNSVGFDLVYEIRERTGGGLILDYQLPNGIIKLSNFMSRLDRNEVITTDKYSSGSNVHSLRFRDRQRQIDVLTNSISGTHNILSGEVEWRLSRTASLTRHPHNSRIRFYETGAFDAALKTDAITPVQLVEAAYNNLDKTFAYEGNYYNERSTESNESGQIDFDFPYTFTKNIAGNLKFGGKYLTKFKDRNRREGRGRIDNPNEEFALHHTQINDPDFVYQRLPNGHPLMYNYMDPDFETNNFLGGQFDSLNVLAVGLDHNELRHFLDSYLLDSLYEYSSMVEMDNYETREEVSAGYFMTELNIGRFLMILPGWRYEHTSYNMTGRQGTVGDEFNEPGLDDPYISDTTATAENGRWFPMYHLRIKPTRWFDIRLAYTETLSRPQLNWMLPKKKIHSSERTVEFGRPDLEPQISRNYDIFFSLYSGKIGLLTIGVFKKEIDNLIFTRVGHLILNAAEEGFPTELQGYTLDRPENSPFKTSVNGYEFEWQTNFHWLPKPLDGIVLNINYTHLQSKTRFPRTYVERKRLPDPPYSVITVLDSFRVSDMPDQPDDIANISVGYDKGPFSARLSMLYQGKTLSVVGERPELDGYTANLRRWDLSVKYRLTDQISIYYNINNITNYPDESYQFASKFLTQKEVYGMTTNLGFGFEF